MVGTNVVVRFFVGGGGRSDTADSPGAQSVGVLAVSIGGEVMTLGFFFFVFYGQHFVPVTSQSFRWFVVFNDKSLFCRLYVFWFVELLTYLLLLVECDPTLSKSCSIF